jgi:hypothetical protein
LIYINAPLLRWKKLDSWQRHLHAPAMFVVTEADAAAIRAVYELRRRFPGIADNEQALECARTIASWQPLVRPLKQLPKRPRLRRVV